MSTSQSEFKLRLKSHAALVEQTLIELLDNAPFEYEIERLSLIHI